VRPPSKNHFLLMKIEKRQEKATGNLWKKEEIQCLTEYSSKRFADSRISTSPRRPKKDIILTILNKRLRAKR
jgi:hypothetical protein